MVFRSGMSEASASMNTSQCVCVCVRVGPTSPTPGLEFHSCRTSSLSVKTKATTLANRFSSAPLVFVSILHHPLLISHSSNFSFTCCVCLAASTRCSSPPSPARIFPSANVLLVKMRHGSQAAGMLLSPQTAYQLP